MTMSAMEFKISVWVSDVPIILLYNTPLAQLNDDLSVKVKYYR